MPLVTRRLPATLQAFAEKVKAQLDGKSDAPVASGTATLAAGTKAVTGLTDITANAVIRLSDAGTSKGANYVSAITAGTGFTILNTITTSNTDKVFWEVLSW